MALFDAWRPQQGTVVAESDCQRWCPYSHESVPLQLPSAQDATQQTTLPLFGAASASAAGSGLEQADGQPGSSSGPAAATSSGLSSAEARDVLLFAGGPVWALDWCPAAAAGAAEGPGSSGRAARAAAAAGASHYLAVGCHAADQPRNSLGVPVQGPSCIQVWELSHPAEQPQQPQQPPQHEQHEQQQKKKQKKQQQQEQEEGRQQQQQFRMPRMALALAHDGGLTWHCQWCPSAELADDPAAALPASSGDSSGSGGEPLPRLGLLAAALGDGSLRVWAVPHPRAAGLRQRGGAAAPRVLSVPPVAAATSAALGGSMPSVVDWLPSPPHDLLAVGCWDGSVAIFRLAPGQQQQPAGTGDGDAAPAMLGLELLCRFAADSLPLRTVRWMPPSPARPAVDGLYRHVLLTGGHEGVLRVWDIRDPFQPFYGHVLSSNSTILAADWTGSPLGIVVAMEDASLRGLALDSDVIAASTHAERKAMFSITWRGEDMGAMWGVSVQPALQIVAYGGEDGEVGVFRAEYEANSRRRISHAAVAAWRMQGVCLAVRTPQQAAQDSGLFSGKVIERMAFLKKARMPDEAEAVHRVCWSRAAAGGAAWLASAGAAGLVRCQWVQAK